MCNHPINLVETGQQVKEGAKKVEQQAEWQYKLSLGKQRKTDGYDFKLIMSVQAFLPQVF